MMLTPSSELGMRRFYGDTITAWQSYQEHSVVGEYEAR